MKHTKIPGKVSIVIYLIVAFAIAYTLQIIASRFANQGDILTFQMLLAACMYAPFLATLIARIPLKGMGWVPHLKGKVRYLCFALWAPALLSTLGGLLFFAIFPHAADTEFLTLKATLGEMGLRQIEAQGITIPLYLGISIVQALTIAPFINILTAIGEEVGWRGALYPWLKAHFGRTKGRIIGGIIWGMWHWPVILLAGYEYGTDYIGAPFLGPVVFCAACVVMGILIDHAYEKTACIWIPALMHGAINAFTFFGYLCKPEYADKMILGPMQIGLLSMIPSAAVAVFLSISVSKNKPKHNEGQ